MLGEIARQTVIPIVNIELMGRIRYTMHEQDRSFLLTILLYIAFQMQ